jgi:hypothetical protein
MLELVTLPKRLPNGKEASCEEPLINDSAWQDWKDFIRRKGSR